MARNSLTARHPVTGQFVKVPVDQRRPLGVPTTPTAPAMPAPTRRRMQFRAGNTIRRLGGA